jgi:hypothetical protein
VERVKEPGMAMFFRPESASIVSRAHLVNIRKYHLPNARDTFLTIKLRSHMIRIVFQPYEGGVAIGSLERKGEHSFSCFVEILSAPSKQDI